MAFPVVSTKPSANWLSRIMRRLGWAVVLLPRVMSVAIAGPPAEFSHTVPFSSVKPPLKVLAPLSVSSPLPAFTKRPAPDITPE